MQEQPAEIPHGAAPESVPTETTTAAPVAVQTEVPAIPKTSGSEAVHRTQEVVDSGPIPVSSEPVVVTSPVASNGAYHNAQAISSEFEAAYSAHNHPEESSHP